MNGKTVFIINPASAAGRTGKHWNSLEVDIKRRFPDAVYRFTKARGDAPKYAKEAAEQGARLVVSVGGDGTNHEIINGLFENEKPVNPTTAFASLPMGTGGDLIRSLGVPRDPESAIDYICDHETFLSDVGYYRVQTDKGTQSGCFINEISAGLSGFVVKLVESGTKKLGGKITFAVASLRAMMLYRYPEVRLEVDGQFVYEGKLIMAGCGNGQYFGGGQHFSPHSDLNDGKLNLLYIKDMSTIALMSQFSKIYSGKHLGGKGIEYLPCENFRLSSTADVSVEADGELVGKLDLEVKVLPRILPVVGNPS